MGVIGQWLDRRGDLRRSVDPVTVEEFGYLLGQTGADKSLGGQLRAVQTRTRSGVSVDERRTLGISAWYSGVRYLAETVSTLPVCTYRKRPRGQEQRSDPPWLRKPDVELPWGAWVEFAMMSLLHRGNSYSFKVRDQLGRVVGLRPLHPSRVTPGQATDGTKVFRVDDLPLGYTTREVLHIPALSYDGIVGVNPIYVLAEALGAVAAADEFAGRAYSQSAHTHGYISVPQQLNRVQADELKQEWATFHQGLENAHGFGVLSRGAEYKTIGLDPEQLQLLETRRWGVLEVARMLRIPPSKLFELSSSKYATVEQEAIAASTDSLRPWLERIEMWVNFDPDLMPAASFIEFELDGLQRGDFTSRMNGYAVGIQNSIFTPAEARERERLPYVEGSDQLREPLNMVEVGSTRASANSGGPDLVDPNPGGPG